jgi:phosphoribosylformylglycinamidine synthase
MHVEAIPFVDDTRLVVLGGPAMLIGLGGGAASSMTSGQSSSDLDFASVQRDNAEMQRRCQEVIDACTALGDANPIRLIHDVGAGGLSNALPELVKDAGTGGRFELRAVPNAEPGMAPAEIWCNEAQERYVMAVSRDDLAAFEQICERERCPYAVVGRSTRAAHLEVHDQLFDNAPVDVPMSVIFGKPPKMSRAFTTAEYPATPLTLDGVGVADALARVLRFPAVGSKQFLITIGDRSITGLVARDQMVGPWQVPVADAAVTIAGYRTYAGEAMSMGERPPVALINPAASARLAVAEALTNLACVRVEDLSRVVLSANWMAAAGRGQEDQALFEAVQAVGMALCPALGIAIPVGKDSLSMHTAWSTETGDCSVTSPVTLNVSAFAPVPDVRDAVTPVLKRDVTSRLLWVDLGAGQRRLGGSALAQCYGQLGDEPPDVDDPERLKAFFSAVQQLVGEGRVLAYHDVSDGGLITTLLEMAFAGRCGVEIELAGLGIENDECLAALFAEELGAVLQVATADLQTVQGVLHNHGLAAWVADLGSPAADDNVVITNNGSTVVQASRADLQQRWARTSHHMQRLRDNPQTADQEFDAILRDDPGMTVRLSFDPAEDVAAPFVNRGVRPKVAVLREQGVNGHLEMAAAFERAGFQPVDVHMTDLLGDRMALEDFQVMVACGGFSYGDVLGGGGGWAKSVLFHDRLSESFAAFFARDTLTLGVCNGCQMLSNLKPLVPGGEHWPRFVRNASEQFEARVALVQVNDVPSPWLAGMAGSVMPIAVAHGEGRVEFDETDALAALQADGALALHYVDTNHEITERYPANPNGAQEGIAGVLGAQGRALIMMPHPERVYRSVQNSWRPDGWGEDGPWLRLFRNARVALN